MYMSKSLQRNVYHSTIKEEDWSVGVTTVMMEFSYRCPMLLSTLNVVIVSHYHYINILFYYLEYIEI